MRILTRLPNRNNYALPAGRFYAALRWVEIAAIYVRAFAYGATFFSVICLVWIKFGGTPV